MSRLQFGGQPAVPVCDPAGQRSTFNGETQSQSAQRSQVRTESGGKQAVSRGWRRRNGKLPLQWPFLHTNGCGDFTMLAKDDWHALRGYAEFEMYSMHIDSLFLVAGAHHGLKQHILGNRAPIYHIEHGVGSGWTPEGEEKLKKRLAMARIPQLAHDQFMEYDREMARMGQAVMFNGPDWGLGEVELPEIEVI